MSRRASHTSDLKALLLEIAEYANDGNLTVNRAIPEIWANSMDAEQHSATLLDAQQKLTEALKMVMHVHQALFLSDPDAGHDEFIGHLSRPTNPRSNG